MRASRRRTSTERPSPARTSSAQYTCPAPQPVSPSPSSSDAAQQKATHAVLFAARRVTGLVEEVEEELLALPLVHEPPVPVVEPCSPTPTGCHPPHPHPPAPPPAARATVVVVVPRAENLGGGLGEQLVGRVLLLAARPAALVSTAQHSAQRSAGWVEATSRRGRASWSGWRARTRRIRCRAGPSTHSSAISGDPIWQHKAQCQPRTLHATHGQGW